MIPEEQKLSDRTWFNSDNPKRHETKIRQSDGAKITWRKIQNCPSCEWTIVNIEYKL